MARAKVAYTERKRMKGIWFREANERYREATLKDVDLPTNEKNDTVILSPDPAPEESQLSFMRNAKSIDEPTVVQLKKWSMTHGYSMSAYQAGVTRRYVGSQSVDTWTQRVEAYYEDPFGTQADEAAAAVLRTRKRKLDEGRVTQLCQEQGMDAECKRSRARVTYMMEKKKMERACMV
ncbi:hypothetical protein VE02_03848 [Pseudogymnoascus sp. 03VT05]|nr:hypothetical protein VE02_03848 [Pseudogymnoascus sp. 03VT05]